jgi:xylulokinase
MLPFLNGERTPDLPHARGVLFGLTPANLQPANAYRAAMEGATYALRHGFDALRGAGLRSSSIRLTGGGGRSAVWRQMVADVFELPVDVPSQAEGAAFGAALQALWAQRRRAGDEVTLADLTREHVSMDPARHAMPSPTAAAYREHYERYLRHLQAVTPLLQAPAVAVAA